MKIKNVLLFVLAISVFQIATAQHQAHKHYRDLPVSLLIGFDEKAAIQTMIDKKIPESDKAGYMSYLKNAYVIQQHPDYKFGVDKPTYKKNGGLSILGNPECNNMSFEDTNFVGWIGQTGSGPQVPTWNGGIMNILNADEYNPLSRQTMLTTPPGNNDPANGALVGWDSVAINPITLKSDIPYLCPAGGGVSVRLGNAVNGAEVERLSYSLFVSPSNTGFTFFYAVVLENPSGHPTNAQPYLRISVTDSLNQPAGGPCGIYSVTGDSAAFDTAFVQSQGGAIVYKKWTLGGIDLSPYVGQVITLTFQTGDCDYGGHFGYSYIDASCFNLKGDVVKTLCPGDTTALLVGTPGFNNYQWKDPSGNNIPAPEGTNDSLLLFQPIENTVYTLVMTSTAGCVSTVTITIPPYPLDTLEITIATFCDTTFLVGTPGFNNYQWKDPSGNNIPAPEGTNDSLRLSQPIENTVYTLVMTSTAGCASTVTITIPPYPLDTLEITTTFCDGDTATVLHAPKGLSGYQWNMNEIDLGGENADSITIYDIKKMKDYTVVFLVNGCRRKARTIIRKITDELFNPKALTNIFTPNGDSKNDRFYPYNHLLITQKQIDYYAEAFSVKIFDRWGNVVYETSASYIDGWNGKNKNGKDMPDGVYYWMSDYKPRCPIDATLVEHKGFVHLVR